jgi:hypothetical protein
MKRSYCAVMWCDIAVRMRMTSVLLMFTYAERRVVDKKSRLEYTVTVTGGYC